MTRPGFIFEDKTSVPNEVEEDEFSSSVEGGSATASFDQDRQQRCEQSEEENRNALFSVSRKQPGSVNHSLMTRIMTKCEELQFDLPLYFDGSLNTEERSAIDAHLPQCPLCRQKLSEFEELRAGLKAVPVFSVPDDLIEGIRSAVSARLVPTTIPNSPAFHLIERRTSWAEIWLIPSSVASMATLVFGFTLLFLVLSSEPTSLATRGPSTQTFDTTFLLADGDLSPDQYAQPRLAISGESPSVNPRGALVALTRSLVRGEMHDDEVVVVADVFGNGLAQIAEVVEPSHNSKAVGELQKALQSDPAYAPFVPARMDQRGETVRVILKIQNVNVTTHASQ